VAHPEIGSKLPDSLPPVRSFVASGLVGIAAITGAVELATGEVSTKVRTVYDQLHRTITDPTVDNRFYGIGDIGIIPKGNLETLPLNEQAKESDIDAYHSLLKLERRHIEDETVQRQIDFDNGIDFITSLTPNAISRQVGTKAYYNEARHHLALQLGMAVQGVSLGVSEARAMRGNIVDNIVSANVLRALAKAKITIRVAKQPDVNPLWRGTVVDVVHRPSHSVVRVRATAGTIFDNTVPGIGAPVPGSPIPETLASAVDAPPVTGQKLTATDLALEDFMAAKRAMIAELQSRELSAKSQ
jgi:hypothetical protein